MSAQKTQHQSLSPLDGASLVCRGPEKTAHSLGSKRLSRFNTLLILRKSKPISAMILAVMMTNTTISTATAFTGKEVASQMSHKERGTYLAGIVDGFAHARWIKDKPDQTGYNCILNWYYQDGDKHTSRINTWFTKNPEKPANALLYVLIKKDCGV